MAKYLFRTEETRVRPQRSDQRAPFDADVFAPAASAEGLSGSGLALAQLAPSNTAALALIRTSITMKNERTNKSAFGRRDGARWLLDLMRVSLCGCLI